MTRYKLKPRSRCTGRLVAELRFRVLHHRPPSKLHGFFCQREATYSSVNIIFGHAIFALACLHFASALLSTTFFQPSLAAVMPYCYRADNIAISRYDADLIVVE